MKIRKLIAFALMLFTVFAFASCSNGNSNRYEGKTKVVYVLEGGTYKNSKYDVSHYYSVEEGETSKIYPLDKYNETKNPVERSGYKLIGWFKTKTGEGDSATYSDPWNFETDTITSEGVTLYAKWEKLIKYQFVVCCYDEKGEIKELGSYDVQPGAQFEDWRKFYNKNKDYTFLGTYSDIDGNPVEEKSDSFVFNGTEENPKVYVFADYLDVKGDFTIVRTAKELKSAKNGIYLLNDIDMEGAELSFANFTNKMFYGNGYKISNFKMTYQKTKDDLVPDFNEEGYNTLCIGLFGDVTKSTIKDVTFENFTIEIATPLPQVGYVVFAPIAVTMVNSTISNVNISGVVTVTELPNGFNEDNLIIITDKIYYEKDDVSSESGNTVTITVTNDVFEENT